MDRRIMYGLLIALVILIALAWLLDTNLDQISADEPGSVTPTLGPLWSVDSASIKLIRIKSNFNGTIVEIQKSGGKWLVMDIPAVEADQTTVTSAITSLAKMVALRDFGEDLVPEEYGLAKPEYELTLQTLDGKEFILEIGAETPQKNGYYVRLKGTKRIYTVKNTLLSPIIGYLTTKPLLPTAAPTFTVSPTITITPTITKTPTVTITATATPVEPTATETVAASETPGTSVPTAASTPAS